LDLSLQSLRETFNAFQTAFNSKKHSMDWLFITLGILFLLVGIIGAILPGIPGPAISFVALIFLELTNQVDFSTNFLAVMFIIMAGVTVLDYVVPIWGTKKFGGTKRGVWGSTIGLIVGIFILPLLGIVLGPFGIFGIILGPFVGAYIGESTGGQDSSKAMKSAIGSFIGFLTGTFMKLVYSIVVAVYFFMNLL
jgi:uncharacterized protein YqgC (DUF456 family)